MRLVVLLLLVPALSGCLSGDFGQTTPDQANPDSNDAEDGPDAIIPAQENRTNPQPMDPSDPRIPANQTQNVTGPWIWPHIDDATIRPGVQMVASGSQCTSNFVFLDPNNTTVYLGFAAHCVAGGGSSDTNGCTDPVDPVPLGTPVEVQGANKPATLVYSSWTSMIATNEADNLICPVNDFAVVAIHPDDAHRVHPAMLTYGGPTGMARPENLGFGDKILTFGNTGLRPGPSQLDAREGYVYNSGSWSTTIYAVTPGLPGDSGSGVLTGDGEALGVLVTVSATGSNGVTSLFRALQYADQVGGVPLELATWDLIDSGNLP